LPKKSPDYDAEKKVGKGFARQKPVEGRNRFWATAATSRPSDLVVRVKEPRVCK